MSADLGKDVYTVQMLQRKHEGYENELVALEAQLQIVVDDAENLKSSYPGENATQIGEQQVAGAWRSGSSVHDFHIVEVSRCRWHCVMQ